LHEWDELLDKNQTLHKTVGKLKLNMTSMENKLREVDVLKKSFGIRKLLN